MVIKTVLRYLKIYKTLLKFSFIQATTYPVGFITELLVELGYQPIAIIFFKIMYGNVTEIAGWSYYEILFLVGLTIVVDELFLGLVYIWNLRELPRKVRSGDVDLALLLPINSMFNLTLGRPYFTSVISTAAGFYIMAYSFIQLGNPFSFLQLLFGLIILVAGLVMCYSFGVILTSLTFKLSHAYTLPYIAERIFIYFANNPHHIYRGLFRTLFFFVIPVVFVISVPSTTILRGIEWHFVWQSILLAAVFLFLAAKTWTFMLRSYSSASS